MKPSQLLLQFLRAWLDWAESGAPEANEFGFKRHYGLCQNSRLYIMNCDVRLDIHYDTLEREMHSQFNRKHLDVHFPFNLGDREAYEHESIYSLSHLNYRRLQWVRDMLEDRP